MRWSKAWIVAKKDLLEFRRNRYILYTLIITPIIMSVVIPLASVVPLQGAMADVNLGQSYDFDSLDLENHTTYGIMNQNYVPDYINISNNDTVNLDYWTIENLTLKSVNIKNSVVRNVTINEGIISNSVLINVTLESALVKNSTLIDVEIYNGFIEWSEGTNITIGDVFRTDSDLYNLKFSTRLDIETYSRSLIDSMLIFFIMIPAILPTVIASYSFIGEKQNKSLEPLLATPTTDMELLMGKSLSVFIPTMAATLGAFVIFSIVVNSVMYQFYEAILVPDARWLFGILIIAPLFCILGIMVNVLISTKVNDVRASQQIGSLVVLPVVVLFIATTMGVFSINLWLLFGLAIILILFDLAVFWLSLKAFNREKILVHWK